MKRLLHFLPLLGQSGKEVISEEYGNSGGLIELISLALADIESCEIHKLTALTR